MGQESKNQSLHIYPGVLPTGTEATEREGPKTEERAQAPRQKAARGDYQMRSEFRLSTRVLHLYARSRWSQRTLLQLVTCSCSAAATQVRPQPTSSTCASLQADPSVCSLSAVRLSRAAPVEHPTGARAAKLLSETLPLSHRVVVIDRQRYVALSMRSEKWREAAARFACSLDWTGLTYWQHWNIHSHFNRE